MYNVVKIYIIRVSFFNYNITVKIRSLLGSRYKSSHCLNVAHDVYEGQSVGRHVVCEYASNIC